MGLLGTALPMLSLLWKILGIVWNVVCLICIVLAVLGFVKSL